MSEQISSGRPLDGVKVLDLARVLAGPLCSAMLADLGAAVTKVELPGRGDDSRSFTPQIEGESTYFMLVNRGKKSITLDLKSNEGRSWLLKLIEQADVLVENFRPGVTKRLGVDFDTVSKLNPRLIYVSISGFGQDGPLAHRAAYDHVVQAMGGIMSVTGWPDGVPTRVGDAIGDVVAGMYGSWATLAALLQRERSGKGQHIDVALLDSVMSLQVVSLSQILGGGKVPGRVGNSHPISAPMDAYEAEDGIVVIAVANDPLFARFAVALGDEGLAQDPRFLSDADRLENQAELRSIIEAWTRTRSVVDVVDSLEKAGVPAAPIHDLAEAIASPHAQHRQLIRTVHHETAGEVKIMPQPVHFSGMAAQAIAAAPLLGQHTEAVLAEDLGLSQADIEDLKLRGVV